MRSAVANLVGVLISLLSATASAQSDWDIVLNGHSVHVNAAHEWNEENWGLGVEKEFNTSGRWVKVALANGFKDSQGAPSFMAGGGLKRRFRMHSNSLYLDVGVIGFLMTREDVNSNEPFPGALPALTFGSRRVAVNLTYMPEAVVGRVTNARLIDPDITGVFFLQLKLDASLFGFRARHGLMAHGGE